MIKGLFRASRLFSFLFFGIFVFFGGFAIYFGINSNNLTNSYTESATATITYVNHNSNEAKATFNYNGQNYIVDLDYYSSDMDIGDTTRVRFDPLNPTNVTTNFTSTVLPVVGGVLCAIGVFGFVGSLISGKKHADIRAKREEAMLNAEDRRETYSNYDFGYGNDQDVTYYFHYCGKANQGHCLEDEDRNLIYEAKLTKFRLFSASDYDFINHKRGLKTQHKVGKVVSSSTNGFTCSSGFKFDGINIWAHLDDQNIYFRTNVKGLMNISYDVVYRNQNIGTIVTTGSDVFGTSTNKLAHIPARGFFRITTKEAYIDQMFLLAFALARTEASFQNM